MSRSLYITGAAVLDVRSGVVEPDRTIVIEDGMIVAVEAGRRTPASPDTPVLDAAGKTVMPGLIDCHVHVTAAELDLRIVDAWPESLVTAAAARELSALLARGFTTVRDMTGADYGLAQALEQGLLKGPRLLQSGRALTQTGGHADMRPLEPAGCCQMGDGRFAVVVDGEDEARRAAREQLRRRADQLKLMLGGGVASPYDRIDSIQMSEAEIRAVVEEARNAGRYVAAHAYTDETVQRALACGVHSIEHGNLIGDETARAIAAAGAFLVPTLVTYDAMKREGAAVGLDAEMSAKLATVSESGLVGLERARDAGVRIAFGTDLLGPLRRHQLDEFRLRSEVLPPIEIIRSATVDAAELVGHAGRLGVVEPGFVADLLVLDGDPLANIAVLTKPDAHLAAVVQRGDVVIGR